MLRCAYLGTTDTTSSAPSTPPATTAFLEKGEPLRERSPQHSVSTKGLGPCASQPGGPFSSRTAVGRPDQQPLHPKGACPNDTRRQRSSRAHPKGPERERPQGDAGARPVGYVEEGE